MQAVHLVGLLLEHVEQGKIQLGLHVWEEVKKNPKMQDVQTPLSVQSWQFILQATQFDPLK